MTEEEIKNAMIVELSAISARMIKCMGEFLDLNNINKWNNIDHLEALRQELNTLMGKFLEVQSDKRNPHIIEDFELEERKVNMEAEETLSKLLMTELEERKANMEEEEVFDPCMTEEVKQEIDRVGEQAKFRATLDWINNERKIWKEKNND